MPGETRRDKADRIRGDIHVLVERSSWRQAASATGVSVGALRSFVEGGVPQEKTMRLLEDWWRERNRAVHETGPVWPGKDSQPDDLWINPEDMGLKIQEIRNKHGLTQQQLAEMLGIPRSQSDISRWEAGRSPMPRYEILERIARIDGKKAEIFRSDYVDPSSEGGASGELSVTYGDDPTVVSTRLDISILKPRARKIYDQAVGSFYTRGWPQPIIERAANDLFNYVVGARTLRSAGPGRPELTEDEQCMVLEGNLEAVEMAYGPNGVVRKF
jgi:transcriptional regulator with XRE-family HTH domain